MHLKPFTKPVRNLAKIDAEYDKDKYAKLLAYHKGHPEATIADIVLKESPPESEITCFSMKGGLFLTTIADFLHLQDEILVNALTGPIGKAKVVVELGCGYGYNLALLRNAFPKRRWVGGEYSPNAIELASRLFTNTKDISVLPFNWYDDTWAVLENLPEKALIFTRHTIEQLPQAKSIAPTLRKYKHKIQEVVHLEPVYELIDRRSTLGMMRRAYTLMNDYNTDLLTTLKSMKVKILKTETDILGGNPLNPTSLVRWKFAGEQGVNNTGKGKNENISD